MSNVVNLHNKTSSSTPEEVLEKVLADIRSGKNTCKKLLVLTLDDDNDKYYTSFYSSKIKASESITLMTCEIHLTLKEIYK